MCANYLKIEISKEDLSIKKKLREKIQEIPKNVCALLNSNGGTLELFSAEANNLNPDVVVRVPEELSRKFLNTSALIKIYKIYSLTSTNLILKFRGSLSLVTLNYNIFLPSDTQLLQVLPSESDSKIIRKIIERKIVESDEEEKVPANFTVGQQCGLRESQTVQFKNLKAEKTNNCRFADRVISNKFTHYVSAFANHRGGRIYYGINDDGVVAGEEITVKEQLCVKNKMKTEINKMYHPVQPHDSKSKEASGIQYSVTFKCVNDDTGESLESTFIMIVWIKPFFGGVFTDEPESYYVENNKVVKIKFDDWLLHFKMGRQPWSITVIPQHMSRVKWSSLRNRGIYIQFTVGLVQCRNDNDMVKFNMWEILARSALYPGTSADLIVKSEMVAVLYKRHQWKEARELLQTVRSSLNNVCDSAFYETKALYLESRIKRAQGKYNESYEIAQICLRSMANLPAEFITVWCYMQLAMLANVLGARQNNPTMFLEAQKWLELALRDACGLHEFPNGLYDVQQKLYIYRVVTLLKCSLTGEVAKLDVSSRDIDAAVNELSKLDKSHMTGNLMSQYREIQHLFAQCCLFLRHSEHAKGLPKHQYLTRVQRWLKQAITIANECEFEDMVDYANSFEKIVEERMKHN